MKISMKKLALLCVGMTVPTSCGHCVRRRPG